MNNRPTLSVGDIPIAPRKARKQASAEIGITESTEPSKAANAPHAAADVAARTRRHPLPKPSEEERRETTVQRALDQEKARTRLRDLKRAQTRESKHFVNVPLDYETKMRLQKASFENDLKMTVIMKAAIDQYLRDNGY
ncbi:hypothetical protein HNQ96_005079 [Aminobacter lissarensis]|uniref:Uncharacterized protein n=1 Tax=Aminobacter carboxidus TaxID=376165 RepID=A0A8E1WKS5_9HYPH|nr:hypothetical protein [Aminobacter lissarensis]MBB6469190.1 hypothetical protein [Aminobacter lissarensis]